LDEKQTLRGNMNFSSGSTRILRVAARILRGALSEETVLAGRLDARDWGEKDLFGRMPNTARRMRAPPKNNTQAIIYLGIRVSQPPCPILTCPPVAA